MAEDENPLKEGEQKLEKALKSEPWYAWAGAAVAAGVVVYYVWKRKASATATTAASTTASGTTGADAANLNGFAVDSLAGLPYGSEDASGYDYQSGPVDNYPGGYSEVGVNGSNYPIIPYGDTPIYDSNGNLIGFQQPNPTPTSPAPAPTPTPTPTPSPAPTPASTLLTKVAGPLASTPGGTNNKGVNLATVPANTTLTEISGPVSWNNNQYYQVTYQGKTGYVNKSILAAMGGGSLEYMGGGGIPDNAGGFHLAVNQGRNTMDQWTFSNGMHQDFDSFASVGE